MNKLNILVIDDYAGNIASAKETLSEHNVVTADTVGEAQNYLRDEERHFDAVLTDLFLPLGDYRGSLSSHLHHDTEKQHPIGLVFAIKAANLGIRSVICTDSNHHVNEMCAMLDLVGCVGLSGGDVNQTIARVDARSCMMIAYWDEEASALVHVIDDDDGGYPSRTMEAHIKRTGHIIKDWSRTMELCGLFPEIQMNERKA
jgi:CheY-like chemotaxis protein